MKLGVQHTFLGDHFLPYAACFVWGEKKTQNSKLNGL